MPGFFRAVLQTGFFFFCCWQTATEVNIQQTWFDILMILKVQMTLHTKSLGDASGEGKSAVFKD